ncbi:class F sortase [Streptomyces europaeiscabiei]|uniref:class F sortase n=1 Tax=Streptomyces europaeiscabiei TaxID=146819 RepID=UPI0029AEF54F|nr:class F sortase [Streptomyces europaeiscabiei]MDX2524967.1 class F sortase [Streptomyces europaeiscabiei]
MTVALVVGGVHLAEDRERTASAEARSAWAGTGAHGAVPRAQASLHFTTPPPDESVRAASPSTPPRQDAKPTERTEPALGTEPTWGTEPAERASQGTAGPEGLTPTTSTGPTRTRPTSPAPAAPARPAPATGPAESKRPARPRTLPPSPAKTVTIPYLGIEAPATGLRLDSGRRLPAPPDDRPELVGWYAEGPAPGGPGTAVVVGHRDTRTGPAVFASLGVIKPGRVVQVLRADGRTAVYTVDAVKTYEKSRFPNKEVYGHRGRPELRLITCGGTYDRRKGYASNVVVFAHLTATREPARKP